MLDNVNWPELVLGFSLGFLPLLAKQLYLLIRYFRASSRRKYLGDFWKYHRSTTGSGEVYETRYSIKFSLLTNRLIVTGQDADTQEFTSIGMLSYEGHMSSRQGMIRYFILKDPASHEQLTWYLFDPFHDPFVVTPGIYMALDLEGLPAAGPMMLSRERLDLDWVESHMPSPTVRLATLTGEETAGYGIKGATRHEVAEDLIGLRHAEAQIEGSSS